MPRASLLIASLAAVSVAGLAAAQDQPQQPTDAERVEQPPIEMADGEVVFRDPLSNEVLEIPAEDETTPAVEEFRQTGENPYTGEEEALAEGRQLYTRLCAACHLPEGTGRIGPSLVDDTWKYSRAGSNVGRFEVIHAGAAGAMQAFGDRMTQDEILKVMAYMDELRERAQQ